MLRYRKFCTIVLTVSAGALLANEDAIFRHDALFRPVQGSHGAIAAEEPHASAAGLAVLKAGGNAVDAAVATGFTLAVTYPRAGNLGGGGFMLIHIADENETVALDYREVAPAAASRDMFLNEKGEADPHLSRKTALAIGVPGTVAGLLAAHERYGTLPLADLLMPAIRLAREGFVVSSGLAADFQKADQLGRLGPTARRTYFGADGLPPEGGEILVQPDLADSLERIAQNGLKGFYAGKTAAAIVETVSRQHGLLTLEDLAGYAPVWRKPVRGRYRDHEVLSMPPPSSGGVHLIQMLNLLENFPLRQWGHNSAQTVHILCEVMKRAYADRSQFLGDPDFVEVPQAELLSEAYEQLILERVNSMTVTPSRAIRPGKLEEIGESHNTTHFSIVDAGGNAVSNTYTLNFSFGCGIMAEGTGILLNNEMDDFSAKTGVPNAYGLIGGEANAIEPGKRMLSSMTPTIVLKDGAVRIVTGSPGGSRIITTVLQVILNILDFQMNAAEANAAVRVHHQWLPDKLDTEPGFPVDTLRILQQMGYAIEIGRVMGAAQTITVSDEKIRSAASDPRRDAGTPLAY